MQNWDGRIGSKMKIFSLSLAGAIILLAQICLAKLDFIGFDVRPYFFENEKHELQGINYLLMQEFCKEAHEDCTFKLVPLRDGLQTMERGEADGLITTAPIDSRTGYLVYSDVKIEACYGFLTSNEQAIKIKSVEDLAGKKIFVYSPSAAFEQLQSINKKINGKISIIETADLMDPLTRLRDGISADPELMAFGVVLMHKMEIDRLKIKGLANVKALQIPFQITVGFSKKRLSKQKIKAMNKILESTWSHTYDKNQCD